MTDLEIVNRSYPQCLQADPASVYVAVRASVKGNGLAYASTVRLTFGLALWIAIIIHIIGVEIYVCTTSPNVPSGTSYFVTLIQIRLTESSNQHRCGFILQRNDDEGGKASPDDH
jgi:hypothetical protein